MNSYLGKLTMTKELAELDKLLVQIRVVSGLTEYQVTKLARRLWNLSHRSGYSLNELLREWYRRYIYGWSSKEIRKQVILRKVNRLYYNHK